MAGVASLVGAVKVGAREGRWDEDTEDNKAFDPHNMGSVVLGTFILWFGWYGFNCGSTLKFDGLDSAQDASLAAVNTTLSGSGGGITVFFLRLRANSYDLSGTCNGILAGLVAISAGCVYVYPSVAIVIGVLGGIAMECGHILIRHLHIDDPLDAFAVHACAGATGVLVRPLFDKTGVDGKMFGALCLALVCIGAWSGGWTLLVFGLMKTMHNLRISIPVEETGSNVEFAQPEIYRSSS